MAGRPSGLGFDVIDVGGPKPPFFWSQSVAAGGDRSRRGSAGRSFLSLGRSLLQRGVRSRQGSAGRSLRARRPAVLANMRALRRLRPAFKSHVRPAASGRSASVDTGALQVSTCVQIAGEARAVHGRRRRTWSCSTLVRQPAAAPWRKAASRACSSQASPLGWGLYSKRRPFSTVLSIACVCTENHTPNRRRTRHRTWTKRPRSAA